MKSGSEVYVPEAGDLCWFLLDPVAGHEQGGHRPGLVLTRRLYNARAGRCLACPITSKVGDYPFTVVLPEGLSIRGAVLSDQARTLAYAERGARHIGTVPPDVLEAVRAQIADLLDL